METEISILSLNNFYILSSTKLTLSHNKKTISTKSRLFCLFRILALPFAVIIVEKFPKNMAIIKYRI